MEDKDNKIFIGIDVSRASLDISLSGKHFKIENDSVSISAFIKAEIDCKKVALCVLESTGGYERLVMNLFQQKGIPVHRAHPNVVKAFGRACKYFAKTDKIDAKLLERYAKFTSDEEFGDEALSQTMQSLKDLRSLERNLEESLHMYQCRSQHLNGAAKKHVMSIISMIKKQLLAVNKDMAKLIKEDEDLSKKAKIMTSYKGVGDKIARVLLVELPELGGLSKQEIASLVGVAPRTHESGAKIFNGHINGGRFYARKALYMAALVAMRHNETMANLYKKMISNGKAAKVALTAIMRKIIVCLNAMVKNNEIYS